MNRLLQVIMFFIAIIIAGSAAYFSISGITAFFGGVMAIGIMAGILEASKIFIVTYLHRFWKYGSILLKIYLISALIVLMIITSAGIAGFLIKSYQETKKGSDIVDSQIESIQHKIDYNTIIITELNEEIAYLKTDIKNAKIERTAKRERISKIDDDTTRTEWSRRQSIKSLKAGYDDGEVTALTNRNNELIAASRHKLDSIRSDNSNFKNEIYTLTSTNHSKSELAPLLFVAQRFGVNDIGIVVNYFILLIIVVFDPLAIAFIVMTNELSNTIKIINEAQSTQSTQLSRNRPQFKIPHINFNGLKRRLLSVVPVYNTTDNTINNTGVNTIVDTSPTTPVLTDLTNFSTNLAYNTNLLSNVADKAPMAVNSMLDVDFNKNDYFLLKQLITDRMPLQMQFSNLINIEPNTTIFTDYIPTKIKRWSNSLISQRNYNNDGGITINNNKKSNIKNNDVKTY